MVEPLALNVGANAAAASRTTSVTTQVRRGCRPTRSATRPHRPLVPTTSSACTWSSLGANGQNALRPKSSRTAGRKVSDASSAPAMPSAPTGPRPDGAAQLGEQQAEQAEDDGGGRGDDRLDRAPPRPLQRHPRARLVVQLLLEPADEQQGVVGRGADDEDEQDALRLARQRDDVVEGQLVDDQRGRAEPEHGAEQHGERQDRAAVDDEQDDEHDEQRDAEQDAVDAGERRREVGDEAARARRRSRRARPAPGCSRSRRAWPRRPRPARRCRRWPRCPSRRRAAPRRARPCRPATGPGRWASPRRGSRRGSRPHPSRAARAPGTPCANVVDGLEVLGRQGPAVGALDDDEVGQRVALDEGRDGVADQRRLGALGQEGRVVVGLDAGELALGGAAEAGRRPARRGRPGRLPRWRSSGASGAGTDLVGLLAHAPEPRVHRADGAQPGSSKPRRVPWAHAFRAPRLRARPRRLRAGLADPARGPRPGRRRRPARHHAAARARRGLHRRQAHRGRTSGPPTAPPSSTSTAAARSPGTAPASSSATRSCG